MKMKKAKLFMMLALLVMGVGNVWGATKDYYVNYEREFLGNSAGYTIDEPYWATITKFGDLTSEFGDGISEVGDRMIRVESDYISSFENNISDYIKAKPINGYTTRVVLIENSIYICYIWTQAYDRAEQEYDYQTGRYKEGYTIYLKNNVITSHEWKSGKFTYSDLYVKTNSRRVKNVIKLPSNQCAIRLNTYRDETVTIPIKDPTKSYDVVAIQSQGMVEAKTHTIKVESCSNVNYYPGENDHSNSYLKTVTFTKTSKVRSIGDYAFESCKVLTTIEIPQSVEYLGEAAFSMCENIIDGLTFERKANGTLDTKIKVIRNYTFWLCRKMTNLELPDGIIIIEGQQGGAAMQYMLKLGAEGGKLRLPNTLVAIGPHFLCVAKSLTELDIPASVRYIDGACFHGCGALRSVYLLGPASALQASYTGSDTSNTFDANDCFCGAHVNNCTFYTTQENLPSYATDATKVWPLIADNQNGSRVLLDPETNQPLLDKDGNQITCSVKGEGYHNVLTYIPDQVVEFTPGKWVTVIFPTAYTQAQLQETFGSEVVLAKMTGFLTPDWSVVNGKRTYHLNFTQQTAAEKHIPYMIKPGQKNGTNPYNVTMIAASKMDADYRAELTKDHALSIEASDHNHVVMYGRYRPYDMEQWQFYFMNPLKNGVYNTACVFKRIVDPAEAPTIRGFRCYWRIWLEGEAQDAGAGAKSAFFRFADDDETTGIEQTESNISIEIGNIYDLNGRKMDVKKDDLPKGLFIINGKKVMINK